MRPPLSLRKLLTIPGILVSVFLVGQSATTVHGQAAVQVIANGLDNPRGLTFGTDGALYVVEAGRGGTSSLCLPPPDAPPPPFRCYGPSGAVTRITGLFAQQRVVTGLPSLAVPSGDGATGPHDIDFAMGRAWITVGLGGDPAIRAPLEAAGIRLGSLVRVLPTGQWDYVVDISAYEAAANPAGGTVDSNPYGLKVLSDRALIADAGGNALLQISLNAAISTLGVFPNLTTAPPVQSVPTTVTVGPDGNIYVGELTGFPFLVGAARVYRLPPNGGTPVVVATGFTNIIDIAFGPDGRGYVLEHDADGIVPPLGPGVAGRLIRLNNDGTQTVIASAGLIKPGGLAFGPDGAVYVTNRSTSAGTGEVVRIVP